jgi:hypothetical protein
MRGRFRENDWPLSMKTAGRFQRSQLTAFNDHVQSRAFCWIVVGLVVRVNG